VMTIVAVEGVSAGLENHQVVEVPLTGVEPEAEVVVQPTGELPEVEAVEEAEAVEVPLAGSLNLHKPRVLQSGLDKTTKKVV